MDQYVIRVEGVLAADALRDFADVTVTAGSVQTVLHGELPDQSSLAGILDYLDELGVEIVEVLKVPPGGRPSPSADSGRALGRHLRMMRRLRSRRSEEPPLGWFRAFGLTVLLVALYFIAPFGQSDDPLPLWLAGVLTVLVVLAMAALVARRIRQVVEDPSQIDLPTLAVLLAVTVVVFAYGYFILERSSPGEVAGLHTRLDSLYFTLVTMTTVGYGDIHPAGQTARAIACLQLVFNAVFIGALIRTVGRYFGDSHRLRRDEP